MPFVYKNIQMITVSNSSKEDMESIGLGKRKTIKIIHPGIDGSKFSPAQKTPNPSVLYLGRLQAYKSVETAIEAMQNLVKAIPGVTLTITGEGESRNELEALSKKLGLTAFIKFTGKVNEAVKAKLLSSAWVLVHPSTMEGWGITAIEANAAGTPVVASDVPGLRDSVQNPHTGFLVPVQNPNKFAEKIELIIKDKNLRKKLERESLEWARNFRWTKSANQLNILINQVLNKRK
jgi:glycosyltransferase involved in cell wall biosynthesis